MNPTAKKIIFIVTFIIGIYALSWLLSSVFGSAPEIVSTAPPQGATGVDLNASVSITFDKKVPLNTLKILSTPEENFTLSQQENTVILSHDKSFYPNTKYELAIQHKGKTIGYITFTTLFAQSNPRQLQQIQEEVERDYPLALLTPHKTPNYTVVYTAPLTLEIQLLTNHPKQQAINEVKQWVAGNGADPNAHQYIVLDAVLPPPTSIKTTK